MLALYRTLLLICALALSLTIRSQAAACTPEIRLVGVEVNKDAGYVGLVLLARNEDCQAMKGLQVQDIRVTEQIGTAPARDIQAVVMNLSERFDTLDLKSEPIDVLFLVDASKRGNIAASADMIREFLDRHQAANATYHIRTFAETLGEASSIDPKSPQEQLANLVESNGEPHLYGALLTTLRELGQKPNKQLVFVFSRGDNVAPDYAGLPRLPPREQDVLRAVDALGDQLYLFTIATSGLGGDAGAASSLLSKLPQRTIRTDDGFAAGKLPGEVNAIFGNDKRLITSHLVQVRTQDSKFSGRERKYAVYDLSEPGASPTFASIRMGSYNDRFSLGSFQQLKDWLTPTLIGLVGIGGTLAIFYFIVPLARRTRFRRQYVKPYVPAAGRRVMDPMTREPIPPGEPVVDRCSMVVPLQTWRDCGDQCPHYPGCTNNNLQCDGSGRGQSLNFFALNGVNRRLNWVWFGMLGGFVGWLFYALIAGFGSSLINSLTAVFGYNNASTLAREALLGACFGLGLTVLLSIMEERSESRRISLARILWRTALGGLTATLAFGGGYLLLENGIVGEPYVAAAISWIAFGLGLGTVLSLRSSIDRKRGLLGGLLAGVVGFGVYGLFGQWLADDLVSKVVSLLVSGALLGLVLDTVVKLAESYEMEYVAPANYRRRVPLSKWLKSDWNIIIGSQPGSQVYVKWPDEEVLPEHAQLRLDGGRIYLFPQGETLINGKIVNGQKRTQLQNGDLIQLGRRGLTQMRFWEK